jgi:hypothetical protein
MQWTKECAGKRRQFLTRCFLSTNETLMAERHLNFDQFDASVMLIAILSTA